MLIFILHFPTGKFFQENWLAFLKCVSQNFFRFVKKFWKGIFEIYITKPEARSYVYAGTRSVYVYGKVSWNKKLTSASLIATLSYLSVFAKKNLGYRIYEKLYFLKILIQYQLRPISGFLVNLKLIFTDLFFYNLVVLIKLCKIRYPN